MAHTIPSGRAGLVRIIASAVLFFAFSYLAFGQQVTCSQSAGSPNLHAEGLSEQIGDITLICSGGSGPVTTILAITLNANITNRLDTMNNLTNVTVSGTGVSNQAPPTLNSPNTAFFGALQFNATLSPTIVISGIRAALPTTSGGGSAPILTASILATQLNLPGTPLIVGISGPTLLASVLNYGVPCLGAPLPANVNFANLVSSGNPASTIRVTEASVSAFTPKAAGADTGIRFLINFSGYGPSAQLYVPDVIVGNRGTAPTSAGGFNSAANGGTYTPASGQLLLSRVNGADATGAGGSPAASIPGSQTSFTAVTQVNLINGAGTVTYEVLDGNTSLLDSAQIPVFVVVPATSCSSAQANTLGVTLAPVSNASVATQTDPIPRFISAIPASDCNVIGDCTAAYFPLLQVNQTSINLTGSSLGQTQTAFVSVTDGGSSQLTFTASITYQPAPNQSSANWLSINGTNTNSLTGLVDPSAGINSFPISLSANPSALLIPSTYLAVLTINAGSAGTITIPVTFTVGPAGPVIQSAVNAANSQTGPITANSFVAIYGLNLIPKTTAIPTVTFSGFPAAIYYDGQPSATAPTQINVLVPAALGSAATAGVIATIDGVASNTFPVTLAPNAPAVFNPGILNQNNSVNQSAIPATVGDIVQIFLTGLATPVSLPVTVTMGSQSLTGSQIIYAGPVATIPGLEQVNVQIPPSLTFTGASVPVSICVPGANGQAVCSAPVNLYLHLRL